MSDKNLLVDFKYDLSNYSLAELRSISEEGVWSIGQMYDHLLLWRMSIWIVSSSAKLLQLLWIWENPDLVRNCSETADFPL